MPKINAHSPDRLIAIDVARAIALIAMVVAHLYPFPGIAGEFLKGFPAGLFAVLAGVSAFLMCRVPLRGSRQALQERIRLVIRGVLLYALGSALYTHTGSIVVVLHAMGIGYVALGLSGAPRWKTANLCVAAAVLSCASAGCRVASLFTTIPAAFREPYPLFAWSAYMVYGLILARLALLPSSPLSSTRRRASVAFAGAGLAVAGVAARFIVDSQYAVARKDSSSIFLQGFIDAKPHSGGLIDLAATVGMSVLVIFLCLLSIRTGRNVIALQAVGSMSLTVYTCHVLSVGAIVGASTRALFPEFTVITVVVMLLACSLWKHWYRRGPLEWALSQTVKWAANAIVPTNKVSPPLPAGTPPTGNPPTGEPPTATSPTEAAPASSPTSPPSQS